MQVEANYSRSEGQNSINQLDLRRITTQSQRYGLAFTSVLEIPFNFSLSGTLNRSTAEAADFTNTNQWYEASLKCYLNIQNWMFSMSNERVWLGNQYWDFLDAELKKDFFRKKLQASLIAKNLLNYQNFTNIFVTDFSVQTTQHLLLPRYVMLSLKYGF